MLFAVTGSPISRSKSPDIWNNAFRALNIDAVYFRIASNDIAEAVKMSEEIGVKGLNITAPYKEEALKFANDVDDDVKKIGAANCFILNNARVRALNTDWQAVHKILSKREYSQLEGKKALVIGAGGAARSAIYALTKCGAEAFISNRTEGKAKRVSSLFNITHMPLNQSLDQKYAVAVSCIPYSKDFSKDLKAELFIDASYRGVSSDDSYVSGEEWLVFQAEIFFKMFFDLEPLPYMLEGINKIRTQKKHIALTGFMGAGKSFIAKKLAEQIKYDLLDLDELIEQKEGMTVAQIFSDKGGAYFREIEKDVLNKLELRSPTVLATGGGTVIDEQNRAFLTKNFNIVWLWDNLSKIYARVDKSTRPLFRDNAAELLKSRIPLYAESCSICVKNDEHNLNRVINLIKNCSM